MDDPAFLVLLLEQWDRSLSTAQSSLTVDIANDDTSPTPDPVPRPTSPCSTKRQLEPTADGEPKSSATNEPSLRGATKLRIAPEHEPITSDQVREPVTPLATEEFSVEREDAEEGPAHCTSAEGELSFELGQKDLINFEDIYADMPPLIPPLSELSVYPEPSVCPDLSACLDFPPTLPLSLASSTHPCLSHPTICAGGSLVSASSLRVLYSTSALRPNGSASAPGSLVSTVGRPAPPAPSSLRLCLGRSSTCHHLRTPLLWLRLVAPFQGLSPPQSSVAPALTRTSGSLPPPRLPEPWTPPWPSGSSVSPGLIGSPSPPRTPPTLALPTGVVSPSSTMATLSAVGRHHVCGLGLAWLLLLQVPSVSTSDPPWTLVSSLAPPSVTTTMDFVCCPPPGSPSSTRASSCTDFLFPSRIHFLSPLCPYLLFLVFLRRKVTSSRRGGELSHP
ncbi:Zinc metalloprotease ZmpB [Labeo rohita]|uniref:Zinc metalloprotease ZmpB n=1 Tax=Labeo rohita TaxID=84645 RepID=A0ABQ8MXW8_LABRO|nr:Zinc metalloprotease ZmpB [Labeo rohita]